MKPIGLASGTRFSIAPSVSLRGLRHTITRPHFFQVLSKWATQGGRAFPVPLASLLSTQPPSHGSTSHLGRIPYPESLFEHSGAWAWGKHLIPLLPKQSFWYFFSLLIGFLGYFFDAVNTLGTRIAQFTPSSAVCQDIRWHAGLWRPSCHCPQLETFRRHTRGRGGHGCWHLGLFLDAGCLALDVTSVGGICRWSL